MASRHSNELTVSIVEFGDRKHYQMQYRDPISGRKKTKSSGIERITGHKKERDDALKVAAKWEAELREGRYHSPGKITWQGFRERYSAEKLSGLAESTGWRADGIFDALEKSINPQRLTDITADRLSHHFAQLRASGLAENTIAAHACYLKAAMRWAADLGLIHKAPKITKPHRATQTMKGRPITGEEFDRLLAKVPSVVGDKAAPHWTHLLNGLWLSGLRLAEAHQLGWEDRHGLHVDLVGEFPMLRIPAEMEKGNKYRQLPITPDFAALLLATPEAERTGHVFNPLSSRGWRVTKHQMGVIICAIGKAAGVKVNETTKLGKPMVKYASAHDLRRSFGERWASRLMPQVLKELMRHESIETTLNFYVGRNAQTTARAIWSQYGPAASGNSLGNTTARTPSKAR